MCFRQQHRAVDPDPHAFYLLDPDPGGKILQIKTEKVKEITKTAILLNFLSKFVQSSIVSYLRVIFYVFYDYRKLFMSLFFTKFVKLDPDPHSFYLLDPDPHSEKLLDPDPQK